MLFFLQNASPRKPADDIKYDIYEIVDELIDEVIKSTEAQPSVAEVVFDTIQDIAQEGDEDQNETSVYDVTDIEMELDEVKDETEQKPEEPDNKSEISDMSKGTEDSEKESICNDKNRISSVTRIEIGQPGDKPKTEIIKPLDFTDNLLGIKFIKL